MNSSQPGAERRRRWLLAGLVAVLCPAAAVGGVLIAAAHPARSSQPQHHGVALAVVIAAVIGLVLAVAVVFGIQRRNRQPEAQRMLGWDLPQRRATARYPAGEPLTAEQRGIAEGQLQHFRSVSRRMIRLVPIGIACSSSPLSSAPAVCGCFGSD
jgi:uncharacterized membrane protein